MSISQSVLVRPLPNKLDEFISRLAKSKTLYEQNGSRVSFYRTVAGPAPNAVLIVSTVDDWDQWSKAASAIENNADFAAIQREHAADPAAEVLATGILKEFELPS